MSAVNAIKNYEKIIKKYSKGTSQMDKDTVNNAIKMIAFHKRVIVQKEKEAAYWASTAKR